ncbi:MAG: 50S ribosomal protein L13 [Bacteroidota bacterium]|jgi:large subunit ribosomal protein L13|nr:50S ribosomal protein L13 [Bacteroidota bacterium]
MDTLSYKTVSANKETADKQWLLVDATGKNLGRIASEVASLLRGKHKPLFTPHADCGDYVVVINAEKVALTGNKWDEKVYVRYTGYPGGQRFATPKEMMAKHPTAMIEMAVRGMLPKNRLGRAVFRNLYVYAGSEHKQEAQQPQSYTLKG